MYMVDLSGHDDTGCPQTERFGGLFLTIESAARHGLYAVNSSRLHFHAKTLWVRDEANEVIHRDAVSDAMALLEKVSSALPHAK